MLPSKKPGQLCRNKCISNEVHYEVVIAGRWLARAPLFAMGFAFAMPLAGMVLAGLRRKNGGFSLKSPGTVILLFVLMGVACYGCASASINRNQGTPSGTYNLTVTATGGTVAPLHSTHAHGAVNNQGKSAQRAARRECAAASKERWLQQRFCPVLESLFDLM
jgi:hypothetical protein